MRTIDRTRRASLMERERLLQQMFREALAELFG